MDINTVIVIVIIVFAVVVVVTFIRYRKQGSADLTGPFGMRLKVKGKNATNVQKAGINAKGITSHEGGLLAEETTGQGIDLKQVDVKDDVILSSSHQKQLNGGHPESIQPSLISAQALSAGGNITIQQFVGSDLPIAQQIAFFLQQLGLENYRFSKFSASQFEAYSNVWKKLQALRLAGDNLWEEASNDNLYGFGKQLRQVNKLVLEDDIYFEDTDRENLTHILREFGRFYFGKQGLIDIRSRKELEYVMGEENNQEKVRRQIQFNLNAKNQYEHLLDKVRIAFRDKLSKL